MDNILITDKLASYLSYEDVKNCRGSSKLFHDSMTRELRLRTNKILINHKNQPHILTSNVCKETGWDSVNLHWSFEIDPSGNDELGQFYEKFGTFVKTLDWSNALNFSPENYLRKLRFGLRSTWHGFLLLCQRRTIIRPRSEAVGLSLGLEQLLPLLPNLAELTFGEIESSFWTFNQTTTRTPITHVLLCLKKLDNVKLKSLDFGSNILSTFDLEILHELKYELKNFAFIGHGDWTSSRLFDNLVNSWSETLESLRITGRERFQLVLMPRLERLFFERTTTRNWSTPLPDISDDIVWRHQMLVQDQFPSLKQLSLGRGSAHATGIGLTHRQFGGTHRLPSFINLTTLNIGVKLQRTNPLSSPLHKFLPKCPNLKNLTLSNNNGEDAVAIFQQSPNLENLSMKFVMTTSKFTGLTEEILAKLTADRLLENSTKVQEILEANRASVSIVNLTKLHELTLTGGRIDEAGVLFGILYLKNLEKLTLCHTVSQTSWTALASHPKLQQLQVQVPTLMEEFRERCKDI